MTMQLLSLCWSPLTLINPLFTLKTPTGSRPPDVPTQGDNSDMISTPRPFFREEYHVTVTPLE